MRTPNSIHSMRWLIAMLACLFATSAGCPILFALFAKRVGYHNASFRDRFNVRTPNSRHWLIAMLASLFAVTGSIGVAQAPPAPTARFVVVLDAAHGGDDSGGRLNNQPEKDLTLALSVRLRSLLAARGIQVITTRESDVNVDLNRRAEIANHAGSQACLSLHATQSGAGVHLFTSSLAPAQPARMAAWKTAQAAWVIRSLALAGTLNSALLHAGMTVTLGRAALPAVDSMTCPAVAVEIAPDSTPAQDSAAKDPVGPDDASYQARVTEALAAAILEWRSEAGRTDASRFGEARP